MTEEEEKRFAGDLMGFGNLTAVIPGRIPTGEERALWARVRDGMTSDPEMSAKFGFPYPSTFDAHLAAYPNGMRGAEGMRDGQWNQRAAQFLWFRVYGPKRFSSSEWTGITSKAERAKAARALLPAAQNAIELLIVGLEAGGHNGGPPLDEQLEAVNALRNLHSALGSLLDIVEKEDALEVLSGDLAAKSINFLREFIGKVKNEPIPLASGLLLGGILQSLGLPGAIEAIKWGYDKTSKPK